MALAEPKTVLAPKRVTILGSTGSVGCSTLDLIARNPDAFQVEALTAHRDVASLAAQARRFHPAMVAIADPACYEALRDALSGTSIRIGAGPNAVVEAASRPADWIMAAIVGAAGLVPTLAAARQGGCCPKLGMPRRQRLMRQPHGHRAAACYMGYRVYEE